MTAPPRAVRCEITDLLVESCGHCNGAEQRARKAEDESWATREPSGPGPWFPARYEGTCVDCGEGIVPGETIRSDGQGRWQCSECGHDG